MYLRLIGVFLGLTCIYILGTTPIVHSDSSTSTTSTTTDATAPVISAVLVDNITTSGARVRWDTDDLSDSRVYYGTSTAQITLLSSNRCDNNSLDTNHCVLLSGLYPGITYYFRVESRNSALLNGVSSVSTLQTAASTQGTTSGSGSNTTSSATTTTTTTPTPTPTTTPTTSTSNTTSAVSATDTTPPSISSISVDNVTSGGARIRWTTDDLSDSSISYGRSTASFTTTAASNRCDGSGFVTSHCIELTGLSPASTYLYVIHSVNTASLIGISSSGLSFTTIADASTATQSTATQVTTTATTTTAALPAAAPATAIPSDMTSISPTSPPISDIRAGDITSFAARILWKTVVPTDSRVFFGTVKDSQFSSDARCDGGGFVTNHCIDLSNLLPGMPYYYRVSSTNANGLIVNAGGNTFTSAPLALGSPKTTEAQNTTKAVSADTEAQPVAEATPSQPAPIAPSVIASSTIALESGLQDEIPKVEQVIKQESGVAVDITPTSRPIALVPVASEVAPVPASSAPVPDVIADRTGDAIYTDSDHDGVSDYDEINIYHTDPHNAHTGGSRLTDGERISLGLDPHSASAAQVPVENPSVSGATSTDIFEVTDIHVTTIPIQPTTTPSNTTSTATVKRPTIGASKPAASSTPIASSQATTTGLSFSGRAQPNSFVTLFIFSTPIVVTVKTDLSGSWHYSLDTELPDGNHMLYVASVDASGKILAKSPAVPFTKTAEAAEFTPLMIETTPTTDPLDVLRTNLFVLAASGIGIIGVVTLMLLGMHRDQSAVTPAATPTPTPAPAPLSAPVAETPIDKSEKKTKS